MKTCNLVSLGTLLLCVQWAQGGSVGPAPHVKAAPGFGKHNDKPRFMETKLTAGVKSKAKDEEKVDDKMYIGVGADPWWLANPPWWMPPPPEWGPMPPQEYNEYFRADTSGPPLSSPNAGPMYTRANDIEPPMGGGLPLKMGHQAEEIRPQEDMLPPKEPRPLNSDNAAPNPETPPVNPYAIKLTQSAGAPTREERARAAGLPIPTPATAAFIQLDQEPAAAAPPDPQAGPAAGAPGATPKPYVPPKPDHVWHPPKSFDSIAGPSHIHDYLIDPAQLQVPEAFRYDKKGYFANYWEGRHWYLKNNFPYQFQWKFRPDFRHPIRQYAHRYFQKQQHDVPSYFNMHPYWPNVYDEATAWQMQKLEQVRHEESTPEREHWIAARVGAIFPNVLQ